MNDEGDDFDDNNNVICWQERTIIINKDQRKNTKPEVWESFY